MKYRLSTIMWAFAVAASAMATFGGGLGIVVAAGVLLSWRLILLILARLKSRIIT